MTRDGEHLGVLPTHQAQLLADRDGLDLVEVQPTTRPPVCAILDYSKWKFEKSKSKEQKSVAMKEIRLRPVSNDHDVEIKIRQLQKFLSEKRTVLITIQFKNPELHHKDQGFRIIEKIMEAVREIGKVEQSPRFEGKKLTARLSPLSPKN